MGGILSGSVRAVWKLRDVVGVTLLRIPENRVRDHSGRKIMVHFEPAPSVPTIDARHFQSIAAVSRHLPGGWEIEPDDEQVSARKVHVVTDQYGRPRAEITDRARASIDENAAIEVKWLPRITMETGFRKRPDGTGLFEITIHDCGQPRMKALSLDMPVPGTAEHSRFEATCEEAVHLARETLARVMPHYDDINAMWSDDLDQQFAMLRSAMRAAMMQVTGAPEIIRADSKATPAARRAGAAQGHRP